VHNCGFSFSTVISKVVEIEETTTSYLCPPPHCYCWHIVWLINPETWSEHFVVEYPKKNEKEILNIVAVIIVSLHPSPTYLLLLEYHK